MSYAMQNDHPNAPTVIAESSSDSDIDTATLELLAEWQREDATDDPQEICAAEGELAEFKKMMNQNRALAGERILYP
jgi:hypothetical protein